jgi:pantoate kinase
MTHMYLYQVAKIDTHHTIGRHQPENAPRTISSTFHNVLKDPTLDYFRPMIAGL